MSSRLSAYLQSAKLAKLHVIQAEECWAADKDSKAVKHLCAALKEMITANNNLASIAFNHKPKRTPKPKLLAPVNPGPKIEDDIREGVL